RPGAPPTRATPTAPAPPPCHPPRSHYYVCSIRRYYTCSSLARSAEFVVRALGVEREDDALPADPVQDAPLEIRLVEPRPRRRRSWRDSSGGNRVSKTGRRGRGRDGLETRPGGHPFRRRGGWWLVERDLGNRGSIGRRGTRRRRGGLRRTARRPQVGAPGGRN